MQDKALFCCIVFVASAALAAVIGVRSANPELSMPAKVSATGSYPRPSLGDKIPAPVRDALAPTQDDKRWIVFVVTSKECGVCSSQIMDLRRLNRKFANDFRIVFLTSSLPATLSGFEYVKDDGKLSALLGVGNSVPYIVIADRDGRVRYRGEGYQRTQTGSLLTDMLATFATGEASNEVPITLWRRFPRFSTSLTLEESFGTKICPVIVTFLTDGGMQERARIRSLGEMARLGNARFVFVESGRKASASLPDLPNVRRVRDPNREYANAFGVKGAGPVSMIFYQGRRVAAEAEAMPNEEMFSDVINASLLVSESPHFAAMKEGPVGVDRGPVRGAKEQCDGTRDVPCR